MEYLYKAKADFSGEILIDIPSIKEQFKILKELQLSHGEDGKLAFSSQMDAVEKQLDLCKKHIKKVSLEHVSGKSFSDVDEMMYYKQARELLLGDIASLIINGIDLGK
jgi:hypothetical protein